jgi:hypothetical protein
MTDDIADLAARLRRLEDVDAIRSTWHAYMTAVDARLVEGYGNLFTSDAVVELRNLEPMMKGDGLYRGRDEIVERRKSSAFPPPSSASSGHYGTNLEVELIGPDEALAFSYFFSITLDSFISAGTYQQRLVRTGGRWQIAHLRVTVTYRALIEAADVWSAPIRDVVLDPLPMPTPSTHPAG